MRCKLFTISIVENAEIAMNRTDKCDQAQSYNPPFHASDAVQWVRGALCNLRTIQRAMLEPTDPMPDLGDGNSDIMHTVSLK